jgi:pimeloyl-ACP methyl ester carboxylesterase
MRHERLEFVGSEGNRLAADLFDGRGHPVILLHGGGQTRKSWEETAQRIAASGMRAITVDQRGHGDSDWVESGHYGFGQFALDAVEVVREVTHRFHATPSLVGASLGGLAALEAETHHGPLLDSLVLVDVTPRMDPSGVARIHGFMTARLEDGFASLEEAADAISAFLPNRIRPTSLEGLRKNLRLGQDGRYRWHWDPALVAGETNIRTGAVERMERLLEALPRLHLPVLLVRGMQSELVHEEHAREFVDLAPKASYVDVGGAGHMVAGDRNDVFCEAMLSFLTRREAA